jgi:methylmalonyl-CoA mutase cobalamin-binding subunit
MTSNPTPKTPATGAQPGGLAAVPQIVELADQLSACADQLHERIMREIRAYQGGPVPEDKQDAYRKLLDDELVLRQRANGLYADAATYIVRSLGKSQQHVMALTVAAAEQIRTIGKIADGISLVARLLGVAAAAATGQAAPIVLSLEALKHQLDWMALQDAAAKAGAAKPAATTAAAAGAAGTVAQSEAAAPPSSPSEAG